MSVFPKWLLALAAPNLLPVLCAPLFLFGDPLPLQTDSDFLSFLHYLLVQLLWLVPLTCFFLCFELYRREWERSGVTVALGGMALTAGGLYLLFS